MAEDIKKELGTVSPREKNITKEIRGRDLVTGLPKTIIISSSDILEALETPLGIILDVIQQLLENTPPELSADISADAIYVTGGGALLYGIDRRMKDTFGTNVIIADDPLNCVAIGTGKALDSIPHIEKSNINEKKDTAW
jgi:rod shape-determining protein MreB